jgi:hypothetical protein
MTTSKPCCLIVAMVLALTPAVCAQDLDLSQIVGTWQVDLRPTPDAEPYFQEMVIDSVAAEGDDRIQGTFYGSPITDGETDTAWGSLRFAFVTRDGGGGVYHHTGELQKDGTIVGTSHAVERGFLLTWRAERKVDGDTTEAAEAAANDGR